MPHGQGCQLLDEQVASLRGGWSLVGVECPDVVAMQRQARGRAVLT